MTPEVEEAIQRLQDLDLIAVAPRPIDWLPLARLGALRALLTCEASDWSPVLAGTIASLEQKTGMRAPWRTPDIDRLVTLFTAGTGTVAVPEITPAWRRLARSRSLNVIGPLHEPDHIRDKAAMREWFRRLGLPVPHSLVIPPHSTRFDVLADHVGVPFVLQRTRGSGGVGTWLVQTAEDHKNARGNDEPLLASALVGDLTLNVHGLVGSTGEIVTGPPSLQAAGTPGTGAVFGQHCGNDFAAPAHHCSPSVLQSAATAARRIGRSLASIGWRGVFGIDIATDGEELAVLEINPRVQASTWLLSELELASGIVPTLASHVLSLAGYQHAPSGEITASDANFIVVRHDEPATYVASGHPYSGRYTLNDQQPQRSGAGIGLLDLAHHNEIILTDTPGRGIRVRPRATIGRIISRTPLVDFQRNLLTHHGETAVQALRNITGARTETMTSTPWRPTPR